MLIYTQGEEELFVTLIAVKFFPLMIIIIYKFTIAPFNK